MAETRLRDYVSYVVNASIDTGGQYDGNVEGWDYSWTFPNALLFTISIMTVVGYGHISPATLNGMMFCMIYSMLAIIVFVVMLANVSSGIVGGIVYGYRWPPFSNEACRHIRIRGSAGNCHPNHLP